MSRYLVRLLPRARLDVVGIRTWLDAQSESAADHWFAAFQQAAKTLESEPLGLRPRDR